MSFEFLKPLLGVTVLLSLFVWLIRFVGRTLREVSGSDTRVKRSARESTEDRLAKLFEASGAAAYIAAQNAGPPASGAKIAEHERAVRAREDALRAASHAPIPAGSTAALPNAGRMTGVAILVHCPMCGEPVNDVPTPLPFAVECPGCHRRVTARGDGPKRVSIVVSERA